MSTTILVIGLMVFFAHFLSLQFRKTNIPDVIEVMAPKGLAAAVLAGLPLQYGVNGGEVIRDTTYMVVLVSIALCALLVAAYPLPGMVRFYSRVLNKPLPSKTQEP